LGAVECQKQPEKVVWGERWWKKVGGKQTTFRQLQFRLAKLVKNWKKTGKRELDAELRDKKKEKVTKKGIFSVTLH